MNVEDKFIQGITGIVHVGANTGQEREYYAKHDLSVVWIEPIPSVCLELFNNISPYFKQRALCCLCGEVNGRARTLHVSSHDAEFSTVLDILDTHRELFPDIHYVKDIEVIETRLDSLAIDWDLHSGLVIDTQGTEMEVLLGAEEVLEKLRLIKIETSSHSLYEGGSEFKEIDALLSDYGFKLVAEEELAFVRDIKQCNSIYVKD